MSSLIDCSRLKVSSSVSPQQLYISFVPNMNPITRHKWLKASNCSRVPTIPNSFGIKRWKPMNVNWVMAMSFWDIMPTFALVERRFTTTCILRTVSSDFHALNIEWISAVKKFMWWKMRTYTVPGLMGYLYHTWAWSALALYLLYAKAGVDDCFVYISTFRIVGVDAIAISPVHKAWTIAFTFSKKNLWPLQWNDR